MVIYRCEQPDCDTTFSVEVDAVEDMGGPVWCPACIRLTNNELDETDVFWEGKAE